MSILEKDIWRDDKRRRRKLIVISFSVLSVIILLVVVCLLWITQPLLWLQRSNKIESLVNPERLKTHVRKLAEDFSPRNYVNVANQNKTADYIKQEFELAGAKVSEQTFSVDNQVYRNIVANFGNPDVEKIIIGAHYDTAGALPGADDNASGVAGLIELAYLLSKQDLSLQIELVAYNLEEPPFFGTNQMGSYFHADYLKKQNAKVRLMICLEMIGYFSDEPNSQDFPVSLMSLFYPSKGNFIAVVGHVKNGLTVRKFKSEMLKTNDLPVYSINAPTFLPGVDFSDHLNYWNFGYDAVMITDTAFYRNKNYHTAQDTYEKLNYSRMAQVVESTFNAIKEISR